MLKSVSTSKYKKDAKLLKKQNKDKSKLEEVLLDLLEQHPLAAKYKDHPLKGNYDGSRECHIEPDWLLIYRIDKENNLLILERTGSHSNLFESLEELNKRLEQLIQGAKC